MTFKLGLGLQITVIQFRTQPPLDKKKLITTGICILISLSLGCIFGVLRQKMTSVLEVVVVAVLVRCFTPCSSYIKKQLELIKSYSNHRWHYNYHRICCFKNWFNMICVCVYALVIAVCRQSWTPFLYSAKSEMTTFVKQGSATNPIHIKTIFCHAYTTHTHTHSIIQLYTWIRYDTNTNTCNDNVQIHVSPK